MVAGVILDILVFLNVNLNEKLAAGLILIAISGGGTLANIYIFDTPLNIWTKAFSLTVLITTHIPFPIALIAYSRGKRKLSKELLQKFYFGKNS